MKSLTPAKLSLILFLGVGLLVAGYFVKRMFATTEEVAKVENRTIPMAIADLEPGTIIKESHIGMGFIDPAKVTKDMLLSNRVVVGRVVKTRIAATSAFHAADLHVPGYRVPLQIAKGMRAVSLNLNDSADMVAGLVQTDGYVDVHMTVNGNNINTRSLAGGGMTLTLFKGVKVLAMNGDNDDLTRINRVGNSVTLELTPAQANILILSKDRGKITLSYNPEGKGTGVVGISDENRATLDEILGLEAPEEPEPPFVTEHFVGSGRRAITFRREGNRIIRGGASLNGNNNLNNDGMNTNRVRRNSFGGNTNQGGQQNGQNRELRNTL